MATFRMRPGLRSATPIRRSAGRSARGWRPLASTVQDDELLLEQEILRHDRSHATGATQLRNRDGEVEQGERVAQLGQARTKHNPRLGEEEFRRHSSLISLAVLPPMSKHG